MAKNKLLAYIFGPEALPSTSRFAPTEKMSGNDKTEETKAALRSRIRAALITMPAAEKAAASVQACALLEQQALWQKASSILFYAPMPDEVDVWRLLLDTLAAGKTVLLPRYDEGQKAYVACQITNVTKDIRTGQYGLREPRESCVEISSKHLDLILVPGIAFDLNGHRLGRGKGFYDRLLAVLHGPTCGVAFDQQIVERIPVEPHDIRLSCILTPTRWHCPADPRAVLK